MDDKQKVLLVDSAKQLIQTAELTDGFHSNVKWVVNQFRTCVAELEGEVRALKADVEQREKALADTALQKERIRDELGACVGELREDLTKSYVSYGELRTKLADAESQRKHDNFIHGELKNSVQICETEIIRLRDSVRLWGSLFAVSVCVSFFLLMLLFKGVCG